METILAQQASLDDTINWRDLYRVEKGVAIQAPLLNLLNRKAGYINERLRYIASSLPRLTYTPHPRFVVDSVIQRSLLCKDGQLDIGLAHEVEYQRR
jgi:hypothetical protein